MLNGITLMAAAVFEPSLDYNALSIKEVFHFFKIKRLENLSRYKTLTEVERLQSSFHPRLKVRMHLSTSHFLMQNTMTITLSE